MICKNLTAGVPAVKTIYTGEFMFSDNLKKLGFAFCVAAVSSCGIFQDSKDLPEGVRISIMQSKYSHDQASNKEVADVPAMVFAENWSQSGGSPFHVVGNLMGNENAVKKWKANFGKGANKRNLLLAQPIILNDIVYVQDVEATVSAFNLQDGKKVWEKEITPHQKNIKDNGLNGVGLGASEKEIFAVTGYGSVVAFDAKTGNKLWQENLNALIRTSPNVCGEKLIIQTLDNQLFVLSTKDGSVIWKYNTSAEDTVLAGGAVPACSESLGLIIAGFSNGEVEAFNANIGYPLWSANLVNKTRGNSTTNINAVKASPVIDGQTVYAIGHNDMLAAIDYRNSEMIWSQDIGGTNTPWIAGDYMYVLTNANELTCLKKEDGKVVFSTSLLEEYELKERTEIYLSGPIMVNSKLLVTASNGIVYSISPLNGKIEHRIDIKEKLPYAPISAKETVIFTTNDASIIAYK